MASKKRRTLHTTSSTFASSLNFRPNATSQEDRGGTRPTGEPHSISFVLLTVVLDICKKILLFDPVQKIIIYSAIVFFGSVIADVMTVPRSYFSQSSNILNQYFIKWGWAWLLLIAGTWITIVAHTVGCGRRSYVIKHLLRLVIATLAWMIWMRVFGYIERTYGRCHNTKDPSMLQNRSRCLKAGLFWSGLDISGHTFIIIYTTLILAEEGTAFVGWERIRDTIIKERHTRTMEDDISGGSLKSLSDEDLEFLRNAHNKWSPYLRALFIVMTAQMMLWDIMLMSTVLYYHTIVEKLIGMITAFATWYVTYYGLFRIQKLGILSPGDGLFKYMEIKKENGSIKAKKSSIFDRKGR